MLRDKLDQTSLIKLAKILETKASSKTSFYQVITENFGQKLCQKKSSNNFSSSRIMTEKIFRKTRLVTKFMKKNFIALAEISEVFALAKKQLTQQGLHPLSQSDWLNLTDNFSDATWIQKTQQKISQYLGIEGEKIPQNQAFLATSDIIEKVA